MYDLNNILAKIDQVPDIEHNKLLLLIRCKIYIELKKYHEAKLDLDSLRSPNYEYIPYIYLLREYSDFWSYLFENFKINDDDFSKIGIASEINKFMYESKRIFKFY